MLNRGREVTVTVYHSKITPCTLVITSTSSARTWERSYGNPIDRDLRAMHTYLLSLQQYYPTLILSSLSQNKVGERVLTQYDYKITPCPRITSSPSPKTWTQFKKRSLLRRDICIFSAVRIRKQDHQRVTNG